MVVLRICSRFGGCFARILSGFGVAKGSSGSVGSVFPVFRAVRRADRPGVVEWDWGGGQPRRGEIVICISHPENAAAPSAKCPERPRIARNGIQVFRVKISIQARYRAAQSLSGAYAVYFRTVTWNVASDCLSFRGCRGATRHGYFRTYFVTPHESRNGASPWLTLRGGF